MGGGESRGLEGRASQAHSRYWKKFGTVGGRKCHGLKVVGRAKSFAMKGVESYTGEVGPIEGSCVQAVKPSNVRFPK